MSPYRIAACEDDPAVRAELAGACQSILASWGVEGTVSAFPSADALRAVLEAGEAAFDLFLLDVQMAGTTGLELAQWLYGQGVRNRVIFITGSAEYALAGYSAHPIHYLLKPVERGALEEALRLAWELRQPQALLLQQGGRAVALPVEDVRYLESRDHGVVVHLREEEREFSLSLTDAERVVPVQAFSRCHKSYLVNLAWVEEIGRTDLRLRDGTRLPVSRTFYRPFQSALVRWLNHTAT